jgi:hypothetical protein
VRRAIIGSCFASLLAVLCAGTSALAGQDDTAVSPDTADTVRWSPMEHRRPAAADGTFSVKCGECASGDAEPPAAPVKRHRTFTFISSAWNGATAFVRRTVSPLLRFLPSHTRRDAPPAADAVHPLESERF